MGDTNAQSKVPVTNGVLSASTTTTLTTAHPAKITTITATVSGTYLAQAYVQMEPASSGYYLVGTNVNLSDPGSSNWLINMPLLGSDYQRATVTRVLPLQAGDKVNFCVYQTSGATKSISVWSYLILLN